MHHHRSKPLFVALEGIDGTGKSLQAAHLVQDAMKYGLRVGLYSYTRMRNDRVGQVIRTLYGSGTKGQNRAWLAQSRLLKEILYAHQAQRNLQDLGALHHYDLLICDRSAITAFIAHPTFFGSSHIATLLITSLEFRAVPHHAIYLHLRPTVALERIAQRSSGVWCDETAERITAMAARYDTLRMKRWRPWALRKVTWHSLAADTSPTQIYAQLQSVLHTILCSEEIIHASLQVSAHPTDGSLQPTLPMVPQRGWLDGEPSP